jgi:plastocyanin domain-containing protein
VLIGFALSFGCDKKAETGSSTASPEGPAQPSGGMRVVVGEHGFAPASLSVSKGAAGSTAPITFLRTTDETCAKEVVFPDLGIKKDLPLNTPVTVDVPADSARTLTFQCGMAMYKGTLVVK